MIPIRLPALVSLVLLLALAPGCRVSDETFCRNFERGSLAQCTEDCTTIAHDNLTKPEGRERCTKGCEAHLVETPEFKKRCSSPPTNAGDRVFCDRAKNHEICERECARPTDKESLRSTCKRQCVLGSPRAAEYQKRCAFDGG